VYNGAGGGSLTISPFQKCPENMRRGNSGFPSSECSTTHPDPAVRSGPGNPSNRKGKPMRDKMYHLAKGLYRLATSKEGARITLFNCSAQLLTFQPQNTQSSSWASTMLARPHSTSKSNRSFTPTSPSPSSKRCPRSDKMYQPLRSPTCTSNCGM